MPYIHKENSFDGRRAESMRLVPDKRLQQISPACGENSNEIPASGFVSEKYLDEPVAKLDIAIFNLE